MSELRTRLQRLRAPTSAPRPSSSDDCLNVGSKRRLSDAELAQQLGGCRLSEGLVIIEQSSQFGARHGRTKIGKGLERSLGFFGHKEGTVAFMDTETTGLAGGTGTMVFLLGLAKVAGDKLHLVQYLLTGFSGEPALLEHAQTFMEDVTTFVSYNGKSFDHPLLTTRYRLAGLKDPFAECFHIDLVHPTRRAFRRHWPDCSLRTTEERLLGLTRLDDLPGSQAPQAWFDWVRKRKMGNLPRVVEHNRTDIVSLVALLPALKCAYENPSSHHADLRAIARHYERQIDETAAYEFLLANRPHIDTFAAMELARLARRRGDWALAVATWKELARDNHTEALERLAKYYEHIECDISCALHLTQRLLTVDQPGERRHGHRERRLLRKSAGPRV